MSEQNYLVNIFLDEQTVVRRSPQVEHERKVAIFDLLDYNEFNPQGQFSGPYVLHLSVEENRLIFDLRDEGGDKNLTQFALSLAPFRSIFRDYFIVCDSYFYAIKTASPSRIEAIDMGRRGLHNDGAELLKRCLEGKAEIDQKTARRLFTLICILNYRA